MAHQEIDLEALVKPTSRQREFIEAIRRSKYVLYGGAKGGGKSYILRWVLLLYLIDYWQTHGLRRVRVGLFCEDYPSLKDRQITKIASEFPRQLGTLQDSQVEGMSFILHEKHGGGVIALRNLDDPSKYASSEFAVAAVDELTKNKREVFDELRSIIRWPGIEDTKFIAGTNPGDIGHEWVKKVFIEKRLTEEDPPLCQIEFVKSLPTDNPYNSKSYLDELHRLPEKLKKAYLEGNWDIFAGQYFGEWDMRKHVVSPFVIPDHWMKFRAYDHGRTAPACCKWYAVDDDRNVWVYREFYQSGMDVEKIADEIKRLSGLEQYHYSVADPSIFARTGMIDRYKGETIAEMFALRGVVFLPASNRRVDGWNLLHQYLSWDEKTEPKIRYFSTCVNSTRTLPSLIHDEHHPEDVDTRGEDHAVDCDRYFLMSWHERPAQKPMNEVERKLKALRESMYTPSYHLNDLYAGEYYRESVE